MRMVREKSDGIHGFESLALELNDIGTYVIDSIKKGTIK